MKEIIFRFGYILVLIAVVAHKIKTRYLSFILLNLIFKFYLKNNKHRNSDNFVEINY